MNDTLKRFVNPHWFTESCALWDAFVLFMKRGDSLMSAYSLNQKFIIGDRVEISPSFDLWMQGARFGTIRLMWSDGTIAVRMDNSRVKRLLITTIDMVQPC